MRDCFRSALLALLIPAACALAEAEREMTLPLRRGVSMDFVWVPPGSFAMGSLDGDADEQPVRQVTLRRGFWMGRHEVTQEQYDNVVSTNPSSFRGAQLPVESVSYREVQAFLAVLPRRSGLADDLKARLPTEAEWEYACRGGATNAAASLEEVAWYSGNSRLSTQPVGTRAPNGYGLHDLLGNVWEWCDDPYLERYYSMADAAEDPRGPQAGSSRVVRGGSWRNDAGYCRPANRFHYRIWSRDYTVGFRLVLVPK